MTYKCLNLKGIHSLKNGRQEYDGEDWGQQAQQTQYRPWVLDNIAQSLLLQYGNHIV